MFTHIFKLEIRTFIPKILKGYMITSYVVNKFRLNSVTNTNKIFFFNCYYSLMKRDAVHKNVTADDRCQVQHLFQGFKKKI